MTSILEKLFGSGKSEFLDLCFGELGEMVEQAAKMHDLAVAALLDNQLLDKDLEEMDDVIDKKEADVRRRIVEHMALNPAKDVVATLLLGNMVNDAERLGDYARGLAELIPLARSRRQGPFAERLIDLSSQLRPLFGQTVEAFRQDLPDQAREIMAECRRLKSEFLDFTSDVAASDLSPDMAVVYASASRMMRRSGSHLSNLASAVCLPYHHIRRDDEDA
ncbi:MAG TPA: PhoU domain-containing protein [Acidobacteriota bacterium]|nr:PhoU domain-containing protein [Acidobacteriota bacterium]